MNSEIRIIGVPIDLGQNKRGVDMGPAALRYAGLADHLSDLGYHVQDSGNIAVPIRGTVAFEEEQHFLPSIIASCQAVYAAAKLAVEEGQIPLFIGGDHTLAIGSIGGCSHAEPAGLIWIDAHGDFNTPETTITNNAHGMTLAVLMGDGSRSWSELAVLAPSWSLRMS